MHLHGANHLDAREGKNLQWGAREGVVSTCVRRTDHVHCEIVQLRPEETESAFLDASMIASPRPPQESLGARLRLIQVEAVQNSVRTRHHSGSMLDYR